MAFARSRSGIITILVVPMFVTSGVIGIRLSQRRAFPAGEIELAQALANQAMLAMQLTRLSEKSRQSAVMEERNRMAPRKVHDTLAQGFTGRMGGRFSILSNKGAGTSISILLPTKASPPA
jgi:signal transduction histidine kinase